MMKGSCLCGAVSVEIEGRLERAPELCHCRQCPKQSSHAFAGVNVRRVALTVHGADKVTWFQSSEKVRRGFCSVCGSALFWDPQIEGYDWTGVAMGILESPTGVRLARHTFVGSKGDYYEITDGLPQSESY
jgi:hypothetical protein